MKWTLKPTATSSLAEIVASSTDNGAVRRIREMSAVVTLPSAMYLVTRARFRQSHRQVPPRQVQTPRQIYQPRQHPRRSTRARISSPMIHRTIRLQLALMEAYHSEYCCSRAYVSLSIEKANCVQGQQIWDSTVKQTLNGYKARKTEGNTLLSSLRMLRGPVQNWHPHQIEVLNYYQVLWTATASHKGKKGRCLIGEELLDSLNLINA